MEGCISCHGLGAFEKRHQVDVLRGPESVDALHEAAVYPLEARRKSEHMQIRSVAEEAPKDRDPLARRREGATSSVIDALYGDMSPRYAPGTAAEDHRSRREVSAARTASIGGTHGDAGANPSRDRPTGP